MYFSQVVVRPEDRVSHESRRWLLDNVPGASGILVILEDKVGDSFSSLTSFLMFSG
jgi:hypothetical protein